MLVKGVCLGGLCTSYSLPALVDEGAGDDSMLILMNVPLLRDRDREGVGRMSTHCVLEEQNCSTYANIWKIVHHIPTDILPYIISS
jgi:hypothetical protein